MNESGQKQSKNKTVLKTIIQGEIKFKKIVIFKIILPQSKMQINYDKHNINSKKRDTFKIRFIKKKKTNRQYFPKMLSLDIF